MDLSQLRALGAFKDRSIVQRTVKFKHKPLLPEAEWDEPGVEKFAEKYVEASMEAFFRKASAADMIDIARADDHYRPVVMVFRCVVDEKGDQFFPDLDTVMTLEEWLLVPLYLLASEVNHAGPKRSPPKTSSGANSPSASGGARSRNGRKWSRPKKSKPGSPTAGSAEPSVPSGDSTATSPSSPSS